MARKTKGSGSTRTRVLLGILAGTSALVVAIALAAYLVDGNWRRPAEELAPRMGLLNHAVAFWTLRVLGVFGGWLVPVALAFTSARLLVRRSLGGPRHLIIALAGAALLSAIVALPGTEASPWRAVFAGYLGTGIVRGLRILFGGVGAGVVLAGASLAFLAAVGLPIFAPLARFGPALATLGRRALAAPGAALRFLREAFPPGEAAPASAQEPDDRARDEEDLAEDRAPPVHEFEPAAEWDEDDAEREEDAEESRSVRAAPGAPSVPVVVLPPAGDPAARRPAPSSIEILGEIQVDPRHPYQRPPLDFLDQDDDREDAHAEREELLEQARVLETALRNFGVKGKVTQVQPGPVITRYEIEPAPGQKVAPIAGLSDDLALALRAKQIRIVAPIPGKAAVGIEVPNGASRVVRLGSLLDTEEYHDGSLLNIALGRTISGEPYYVALDALPHLLVAGSTGSGKSVCINAIIASIIFRAGPEDVRFIMIDPKMLELTTYVGIPHLVPPVVSQAKDTVRILKWVVGEMESRYRALAHVGVRSIVDHNKRLVEEGSPKLPYLVVIIDELADLMLSNVRGEIEESIARLAQMARAVGIHLVVATQRPSVDVITGVIKANFPSRIAFQVPTRTDSRTILDSIGAERLLGKGDMLYLGVGMSEPVRVHGAFISTEETNDVVEWLKMRSPRAAAPPDEDGSALDEGPDLFPRDREDDLFEEASRILVAHQQGSISLLQRRLKVGYARAARLVDMMEQAGIVGPFTGSKAREILVPNLEELEKKFAEAKRSPLGGRAT
ncbi:MAG: DNA translocase FtsK [Candidatus Eiseniibacteriota bacterium]